MNLKQLTYFTQVFECGSFLAASKLIGVGQSALSMQVGRLEAELGVKLFERTYSGVVPTSAGNILHEHGVAALQSLSEAKVALARSADEAQIGGPVSFGLPAALSRVVIPQLVESFLEQFPRIDLRVSDSYAGNAADLVRSGEYDFAIGTPPDVGPHLIRRRLLADRLVLLSGHRLETTRPACDLSKLAGIKLILPPRNHQLAIMANTLIREGVIRPSRTIDVNGHFSSAEIVRRSDWVMLSPSVSLADSSLKSLFAYPIEPNILIDFHLIYDQRRPLAPATVKLVDFIERQLHTARAAARDRIDQDDISD